MPDTNSVSSIRENIMSFLRNVRFMLTLLAAILCLAIVILWGACGFPPGMKNFSTYVIFTHTGPAFTIVLWGFVFCYILGVEPPPKLIIYTAIGSILFLVTAILQLMNLDEYTRSQVLVLIGLHAMVFVVLVSIFYLTLHRSPDCKNQRGKQEQCEQRPYIVRVSHGGVPFYK